MAIQNHQTVTAKAEALVPRKRRPWGAVVGLGLLSGLAGVAHFFTRQKTPAGAQQPSARHSSTDPGGAQEILDAAKCESARAAG